MKIQISFAFRIKSYLYLIKININFVLKKIRFVFNKNTDQFHIQKKKIKSVFNENVDQFCFEKKSYLKIQISFVFL